MTDTGMRELADEIERLEKLATEGPWDCWDMDEFDYHIFEARRGQSQDCRKSLMAVRRGRSHPEAEYVPRRRRIERDLGREANYFEMAANAEMVVFLRNNTPAILSALRSAALIESQARELSALRGVVEKAEEENFTLAAGQCCVPTGGLTGDEHGNQFCAMERRLQVVRSDKDGAYRERNQLVVYLASQFPSGIKQTHIEGWDAEWHGCVYIETPAGQMSWHYHDSQTELFSWLPPYPGEWDGHTTAEKYERLDRLSKMPVHPYLAQHKETTNVAG